MTNEWLVVILAVIQGLSVLYIKTRLTKSIEHEFNVKLKDIDQKFNMEMAARERQDRFRLASLDKRMEVHQNAFALGREMLPLVHSDTMRKLPLIKKCEDFWNSSSLYLTEDAREAFSLAKHYFQSYDIIHTVWKLDKEKKESSVNLEKAFDAIQDLPRKLIEITDKESLGRASYIKQDDKIDAFEQKKELTEGFTMGPQ